MLLVACSAVVILMGMYVLMPLFREDTGDLDIELLAETELDRLLNRKAIVYKNEAADILQKLEYSAASDDLDDMIEKEIASRKSRLAASGSKDEGARSLCPSCGSEVISGKKFCADCGHPLQVN